MIGKIVIEPGVAHQFGGGHLVAGAPIGIREAQLAGAGDGWKLGEPSEDAGVVDLGVERRFGPAPQGQMVGQESRPSSGRPSAMRSGSTFSSRPPNAGWPRGRNACTNSSLEAIRSRTSEMD